MQRRSRYGLALGALRRFQGNSQSAGVLRCPGVPAQARTTVVTDEEYALFTPTREVDASAFAPAVAEVEAAPVAAAPAKTHFDVKLKSFDAAQKLKVIKEVRAITNLGLKEVRRLCVLHSVALCGYAALMTCAGEGFGGRCSLCAAKGREEGGC